MAKFVARYEGWTSTHPGIQHFDASTKDEVLEKAHAVTVETGLKLTLISINIFGDLSQIWNAMRSERPERNGDGWWEEVVERASAVDFPEN